MKKTIILGAGQFGRLILELLQRTGKYECIGFIDPAESLNGQQINSLPVLGDDDQLANFRSEVDTLFIGIASGVRRREMMQRAKALGFSIPNLIDPSVNLASDVELGEGILISMGSTVLNATAIGDGSVIGTGVTILHDVEIGTFCTVGGGSTIGAGARIEDLAFIGVGAVVASGGFTIGRLSKLSAGAVALKDLPSYSMAIGNPARVIATTDSEIQR